MSMIRPNVSKHEGVRTSVSSALSAERLLTEVLNSSHDGIMVFESVRDRRGVIVDFVCLVVNPAAEEIIGRSAADTLGDRLIAIAPGNFESGLFDHYVAVVDTGISYTVEHHYQHDGLDNWFLTTAVRLDDGFAVTFRDITDHRHLQASLDHRVGHDQLTGLPNRILLEDQIERQLLALRRVDGTVTVAFLDLDRFKVVNDSLGHAAGDLLIIEVARRLADSVRLSDMVARIGGDEFVVLFSDLAGRDLDGAISRLIATCDEPFVINGHDVFVGVTVGVARTTSADTTPGVLIADADAGMFEAKKRGGNQAHYASSAERPSATERVDLEADLRVAITSEQLRVVYQPVVDCRSGRIAGAEALVRWQHPERGLLSPGVFLPIAEQSGLIGPIGSWVLAEAARQFAEWRSRTPVEHLPTMSVNASAQQLTSIHFCDEVRSVLASTGMSPRQLCIEVTETALIRDPLEAQATLRELSELGVRIALDDFGTGYSPITYLQQFPVDIIKIDRAFISNTDPTPNDIALVDGLIGLAAALGKTVTAEGIEDERQLERVRRADYYQGYYFSKPVTAEAFEALMEQRPR
jgi:diguanylate cyclase (GGDEF)-like protein